MNPLTVQHPSPAHIQHAPPPPVMHDNSDVDMSSYLNTLYDSRWLIATVALVVTLLAAAYAFIAKPVYEASMLIHVEENSERVADNNILGEMGSFFDIKTAATAEMELVRSRLVISRAIDDLRLYINTQPKYFPVIGKMIAKNETELSEPGILGFGGYVWGGEKLSVSTFNVPQALENKEFIVTAEGEGRFTVTQKDEDIVMQGSVGSPLSHESALGTIELTIENMAAKEGAQFNLSRSSRLALIEGVQKNLVVEEHGRQSGVIGVSLKGENPELIHAILAGVSQEYLNQHAARKTEEASKSLAFLNKQLPDLKKQVEQSEAVYNEFRNKHGTIDLGEEARLSLQQSSAAKMNRMELEQKRTELLARYTVNHPIVMGVDSQLRELNAEIATMDKHIKTLPNLEQEMVRLERDVKVNTDLYTALLNTAQQLRLVTVAQMSNVRLVDAPMLPERPISPNRPQIIAIALMLGLMLGVVLAFLKKALHGGIDDPTEVEKMLGVPVYATIPHSKMQKELFDQVSRKAPKLPLLAKISSMDVAVEALRNFRTALQFSMTHSKNNIVLITGPTAGMGKSFVSANLAAVMAASGKRVLLIDSDLRNGHLHRYFDVERHEGLVDAISGEKRLEHLIHREVIENVDFIATGRLPSNPSEVLMQDSLGPLLESLSSLYDVVLIDGSPLLAVSDSLIVGAHAGAIYLLTRGGVTTSGEIAESIKRMSHAGLTPKGVVFNDLKQRPGRYGYGYRYGAYRQVQYSYGSPPLIEASPTVR